MILGSALVSVVRPHPGRALAFHRWYERDHFHAGVTAGPGCFAGRRWVEPEWGPGRAGGDEPRFLHTYWIEAGAQAGFATWALERARALRRAGRMRDDADQLHTAFGEPAGQTARDADGVPLDCALEHPFAGAVLAVLEDGDEPPAHPPLGPAALALSLRALALDPPIARNLPPGAGRALVLWLLDTEPRAWSECVAPLGRVALALPFVPTVPGTDRHVAAGDPLRTGRP